MFATVENHHFYYSMSNLDLFSQQAKLGKNDWWRYLLGFFLILSFWVVAGSLVFVTLQMYLITKYANVSQEQLASLYQSGDTTKIQQLFERVPVTLQLSTLLSTFIFGLLMLLFVVKVVHKRSIKSLITPYRNFSYSRFFHGFAAFFISTMIVAVVGYIFGDRRGIEFTFNPNSFFILLLIACTLLLIQTSFEELFIRGYLLQFLGLKIKNFWSLIITTTAIFTILHLANPEVKAYGVWLIIAAYILPGLFFAAIALWDNRLELSLAAHFANNFFVLLIVSPEVSALASEPIFTITEIEAVTFTDCLSTMLQYGLFCIYFFIIRKKLNLKAKKF